MTSPSTSAKSTRTRRGIVQAALEVWSGDNTRSLGEVADVAGVGRTTLNRYFASRTELVAAVDAECRERFTAAVLQARPDEGTGLAALQRLGTEIVHLGPVLGMIFADNALVDPDTWADPQPGPSGDPIGDLVLRGQADGSIASDLPPDWVAIHVWTSLFAAHLMIQTGSATRHEVGGLLVRTLTAGVGG